MIIAEHAGKKILLNLAFATHIGSFGGKYRSEQLLEIFRRAGYNLSDIAETNKFARATTILSGITFWLRYGRFRPLGIASLRTAGHLLITYRNILNQHPDIWAVVIEGTGFGAPMITSYLKKKGVRIFFAPANIEALVGYDHAWTHRIQMASRLHEEVKYFRQSDGVFCISITDQWLLSIFGVPSYYLPYWPTQKLWQTIECRRKIRSTENFKDFFVYLADFGNEPNYKGFLQMLEAHGKQLTDLKLKIKLVGKGAERLQKAIEPYAAFEMEGFVPEDRLEQLLSTCKAAVLHHYPSSGFLTRVVELWLSGIPIYSNLAASKDFVHMPGIFTFTDFLNGAAGNVDDIALQSTSTKYQLLKSTLERSFLTRLIDD